MNQATVIWRAHLASNLSALRADTRARMTLLIALALHLGFGAWSLYSLLDNLALWQQSGQVTSHLWLVCAGTWWGIAAFSVMATMQQGFGSDHSRLLMTLPLAPSTRFRALFQLVLVEGIGNWLLLASVSVGVPLAIVFHWQALPWLLLFIPGMTASSAISMLGTLLVITYLLPGSRHSAHAIPKAKSGLVAVAGTLYVRAFLVMEGRAGSRAIGTPPGFRRLSGWASRWRGLEGAMFSKGLLNQGRSVFTWGRIAILAVLLALFPVVQPLLLNYGMSNVARVVVYACGLVMLTIIEYAAYAISSEGARLCLFVVAPLTWQAYLRARLLPFMLFSWAVGLAVMPILSMEARLSLPQAGLATLLVLLITGGYTSFLVWGSASDEDLDLVVEGSMQSLLQEELPVTPRRLQLLGLSFALLALMMALVWKLPIPVAVLALALVDGIVAPAVWQYALRRLKAIMK
jgi:hypothetical protein